MDVCQYGENQRHSLIRPSPFPISPIATAVEVPGAEVVWASLSLSKNATRERSGLFSSGIAAKSVDQLSDHDKNDLVHLRGWYLVLLGSRGDRLRCWLGFLARGVSGGVREISWAFCWALSCDRTEGDQK